MLVLDISQQSHHKQNKINKWLNKELPSSQLVFVVLHETGKIPK